MPLGCHHQRMESRSNPSDALPELEQDYQKAWVQWAAAEDELWDVAVGDGIGES